MRTPLQILKEKIPTLIEFTIIFFAVSAFVHYTGGTTSDGTGIIAALALLHSLDSKNQITKHVSKSTEENNVRKKQES